MTKKITIGLMWFGIALYTIWDIYAAIEPTPGDTISKVSLEYFYKHPIYPIVIGELIGHISCPINYTYEHYLYWTIPVLVILNLAFLSLDLCGFLPRVIPVVYIVFFIPVGAWLWPQRWYG